MQKGHRERQRRIQLVGKTLVLAPTFGNFDAFHCCDPTVIEGAFRYRGTDYKYLMAYTGNTSNINNKVGLAFPTI